MWFYFVLIVGSEPKPALDLWIFPFVDLKPQCLFFNFFGARDVILWAMIINWQMSYTMMALKMHNMYFWKQSLL